MRNYQILTLIGSILGMLIAFGAIATVGVLDITITSFENFTDSSEQETEIDRQERMADMQYIYGTGAGAIILYIVALVIAFVIKEKTKIVGIILIILSVVTLILIGGFGVIGFALLLTAGIVALRYRKPPPITTGV